MVESKKIDEVVPDLQVNPLRPPTGVKAKPIVFVLEVELRDVDRYEPIWPVNPKLLKAYLA